MSGNPPRLPDAGSAQPGWVRAIPRDRPAAGGVDTYGTTQPEPQQHQQQQQQAQLPHQQDNTPQIQSSPPSGFASSFSAFFPRPGGPTQADSVTSSHPGRSDLGEYPLYSSRRGAKVSSASALSTSPPFGFSPPSPHGSGAPSMPSNIQTSQPSIATMATSQTQSTPAALQYTAVSRLRRPSVLATSVLPDEDDDNGDDDLTRYQDRRDMDGPSPSTSRLGSVSVDGQDDVAMNFIGGDMDMDIAEGNHGQSAGPSAAGPGPSPGFPRTAAMAIPGRARSHSQSSSVMASSAHLARSPSAWPSSPPRGGFGSSGNPQHLLARLTSEQQQAMVASASSASSAFYMIPTPYRQAMTSGAGGDLLLGGVEEEEAVDDTAFTQKDDKYTLRRPDSSSGLARSFNPLNPYSERPPSGSKIDGSREFDRDNMAMDDSPQQSPGGKNATAQAFSLSNENVSNHNSGTQSAASALRGSKSTPALADLNDIQAQTRSTFDNTPPFPSSRFSSIPFPTSAPSTPPQQSPRDGPSSAKSVHSGLRRSQSASHRPAELLAFTRPAESTSNNSDGMAPYTAPAMGSSFRFQRANSLTDVSRLHRQAGFALQPLQSGEALGMMTASPAPRQSSLQETPMGGIRQDRQASGSSGSDSPNGGPRVVRRAVNHKKGSLMPKSKDHLRTMAQLRLETGEFEVASEAALHRISQSSAAAPNTLSTPSRRSSAAGVSAVPSPFASLPRRTTGLGQGTETTAGSSGAFGVRPSSSAGGKPPFFNPVRNRFPESVADEEEEDIDSSGSEPDYASAAEAGFDPASASDTGGGMMVGEDEEVSSNAGADLGTAETGMMNRSAWTLRDPAFSKPLTPGAPARPGEVDLSPSSALGWSSMARPGKRKFNDSDRFEPYNAAFKRRAVSPASASSVSLSPLLATRDLQGSAIPPPPPTLAALGPAAHISQSQAQSTNSSMPPSPIISGGGTWLNPNKSRANSPAAPTGTPGAPTSARRWPDEDKERKAVDLSKMSLG